jgi:signal transduction histidine kinase
VGFTQDYEGLWISSGKFLQVFSVIESALTAVSPGSITVQNLIFPDFEIFADPIISKVFSTIIENAVRHGKTTTQIVCSAFQSGTALVIRIEDDGIGIPSGEKELIFSNGHGKNTGIGLFLAREILAITGLSIMETGELGKGARFEILVPEEKWRRNNG